MLAHHQMHESHEWIIKCLTCKYQYTMQVVYGCVCRSAVYPGEAVHLYKRFVRLWIWYHPVVRLLLAVFFIHNKVLTNLCVSCIPLSVSLLPSPGWEWSSSKSFLDYYLFIVNQLSREALAQLAIIKALSQTNCTWL